MTPLSSFARRLILGMALGLCIGAMAQTAAPKPVKKLKTSTLSFTCRVVYEPSNAMWVRELEIDYDKEAFKVLRIDGVQAHGFSAAGMLLTTHLDNERIYLDLSVPSWKSQFRESAQGQGVCIKNR